MNEWSIIEISPADLEILAIDQMERSLGPIPEGVREVRGLLTRFEVCHFKYRRRLKVKGKENE